MIIVAPPALSTLVHFSVLGDYQCKYREVNVLSSWKPVETQ